MYLSAYLVKVEAVDGGGDLVGSAICLSLCLPVSLSVYLSAYLVKVEGVD